MGDPFPVGAWSASCPSSWHSETVVEEVPHEEAVSSKGAADKTGAPSGVRSWCSFLNTLSWGSGGEDCTKGDWSCGSGPGAMASACTQAPLREPPWLLAILPGTGDTFSKTTATRRQAKASMDAPCTANAAAARAGFQDGRPRQSGRSFGSAIRFRRTQCGWGPIQW